MFTTLGFDAALKYTRSLSLIPDFPRFDEAVIATAEDLIDMCSGAIMEREIWSPEAQAAWLVKEARHKMTKWTGTADLLAIFNAKFPKASSKPGNGFIDYSNAPCVCGSGKKFKDCHKGKPLPPLPDLPPIKPIEPKRPPLPNRLKPITQDDIDKLLKDRNDRKHP